MAPAFPPHPGPQAAPAAAPETQLDLPRPLAQVAGLLLPHLPAEQGQAWLRDCRQALARKADLTAVWPQLARWLLLDAQDGLLRRATTAGQRQHLEAAANLYQQPLPGEGVGPDEWATLVNEAGTAAEAARATAATSLAAYSASLTAETSAAEAQAASEAAEAAQAAAETATASAAAAARAAARAKALGKGHKAVALAAAKAAAGVAASAAIKLASRNYHTSLETGLEQVQAALDARLTAQHTATAVLAQTVEAAGADAAYAALAAADAEAHLAAATYARLTANDYAASYSLLAADASYANAHHATASFVQLHSLATVVATNQPAGLVYGRLADKLLALLAAAPVTTRAPAP